MKDFMLFTSIDSWAIPFAFYVMPRDGGDITDWAIHFLCFGISWRTEFSK